MINIETEKKKLELKRVTFMREEMEFRILERMAEIDRLRENIAIQEKRIAELDKELNQEG